MTSSCFRFSLAAAFSLWLSQTPDAFGALGIISATFTPVSPVTIGTTVTVTASLAGYSEATEVDGYNFTVTYPAALFNFVGGSFSHGTTAPGLNQQWLAMANQESEAGGYTPLDVDDGSVDGTIVISFNDSGFNLPERGTVAAAGFLVSFQLQAEAAGSGSITPLSPGGAPVFFDTDLVNLPGNRTFAGAPITVVPEPAILALGLGGILLVFRRRSRAG
jgi:hypothetical protein